MSSGILRDDDTTLSIPQSQLSASQQYALKYVLQILPKMEKLSDEYNEDDIDEDNYEHCQAHLLIIIPFIN